MQVAKPLPRRLHTPATRAIQRRLEALELQHLRQVVAEQGEQIERLTRELQYADDCADMWQRAHENLAEHLDNGTADIRVVGLTRAGEIVVVGEGA